MALVQAVVKMFIGGQREEAIRSPVRARRTEAAGVRPAGAHGAMEETKTYGGTSVSCESARSEGFIPHPLPSNVGPPSHYTLRSRSDSPVKRDFAEVVQRNPAEVYPNPPLRTTSASASVKVKQVIFSGQKKDFYGWSYHTEQLCNFIIV
ncbi:unnamed protein product [Discosporangium mesarthrocarpum]